MRLFLISLAALLASIAVMGASGYVYLSAPTRQIERVVVSPSSEWKAEVELEAYGTFGPVLDSVLLSQQTHLPIPFQNQKVFTIRANADGSPPFDIQWTGPKELTITIQPKANPSCKDCSNPSSMISLKSASYKGIAVKYVTSQ
jgi:hypothetical protein